MNDDEQAIRQLVQTWFDASQRGDTAAVLALMADDVLFMVPGQEPFGKAGFAQAAAGMAGMRMAGHGEIRELQVAGEWAWLRNRIEVEVTPPGGETMRREGYTLTVLRKDTGGTWRLFRDANLLAPPKQAGAADVPV